jgi:hypothetical protein
VTSWRPPAFPQAYQIETLPESIPWSHYSDLGGFAAGHERNVLSRAVIDFSQSDGNVVASPAE